MNKNIKQLIERLFDDNDDILLDGIDEVPIADMLQIADDEKNRRYDFVDDDLPQQAIVSAFRKYKR